MTCTHCGRERTLSQVRYCARAIAFKSINLPAHCHTCGETILHWGKGGGLVHHLDENPCNNDPSNLVPMDKTCHNVEHLARPHSEQHTSRIRESVRASWANLSPEQRRQRMAPAVAAAAKLKRRPK